MLKATRSLISSCVMPYMPFSNLQEGNTFPGDSSATVCYQRDSFIHFLRCFDHSNATTLHLKFAHQGRFKKKQQHLQYVGLEDKFEQIQDFYCYLFKDTACLNRGMIPQVLTCIKQVAKVDMH